SPAVQLQASSVPTNTWSSGSRNWARPGKASAKATTDAISQDGVSSSSKSQTSSHRVTTVTTGSRIASTACSSRLSPSSGAGSAGARGAGGTLGPASSIGTRPRQLRDGLGAIGHVQLAEDALHMILDREFADPQDAADLGIGLSHRHPDHDLPLSLAQRR